MKIKSKIEKFWASCDKRESGCWEWNKSLHKDGYGHLGFEYKYWLAHRFSWHLTNGPIPKGMCVCHECDNPKCINPDHLFLGTHADNMHDMKNKGRRKNINAGARNGRAKITMECARNIRKSYANGTSQVALAARYGIAQASISLIILKKTWIDTEEQ